MIVERTKAANSDINHLQVNRRKAVCIVLLFFMISVFCNIVIGSLIHFNVNQTWSLLKSRYTYSAITNNPLDVDSYYVVDAGISFRRNIDDDKSLNANILMQGEAVNYTDCTSINVETLKTDEIAISYTLAKKNGISVGDKVYSRHAVDGAETVYTITHIISDLASARVSKTGDFYDGVVIVGYDSRYIDNISFKCIIYTEENVDTIKDNYAETPVDIIYRDDEIAYIIRKIIPYVILLIGLSVGFVIIAAVSFNKEIRHDFKRLVKIGFDHKTLDSEYLKLIKMNIIIPSLGIMMVDIVVVLLCEIFIGILIIASLVLLIQLLVLFIYIKISKNDLWR